MNALSLVSPDFFQPSCFQLCWKAPATLEGSSYAGRPAKVEKSEMFSFHYKKVSHSVSLQKIHWGALLQISGVF
jgi:hypothetical protein